MRRLTLLCTGASHLAAALLGVCASTFAAAAQDEMLFPGKSVP